MFVSRQSSHIAEDIARNWSSWNFGQEGFHGSHSDLTDYIQSATDTNPAHISGFDIYPDSIREYEFRELYPGYWVAVDNVNARHGLSCIFLEANTKEDAVKEAFIRTDYFGEGDSFDASESTLIYSSGDIHVFEI